MTTRDGVPWPLWVILVAVVIGILIAAQVERTVL